MFLTKDKKQAVIVDSRPPEQLKCSSGCGKVRHEFSHLGPKGPVYTCCWCGAERTK